MAIQLRRGAYADFDPAKMKTAETAIVTSGDPSSSDGKAVYVAFGANDVKRMAAYDDIDTVVNNKKNELSRNAIEQYAGSSLGGSTRSVKEALDTIATYAEHKSIAYQNGTITFSEANQYYRVGSTGLVLPVGRWLVFGNFQSNSKNASRQEVVMISDTDNGNAARKNTIRNASDASTTAHYQNVMFAVTTTQETTFYPYIASTVEGVSSTVYAFVNAVRIHA